MTIKPISSLCDFLGIDSSSTACIVASMCHLVCGAVKKGDQQVLEDARRIVNDRYCNLICHVYKYCSFDTIRTCWDPSCIGPFNSPFSFAPISKRGLVQSLSLENQFYSYVNFGSFSLMFMKLFALGPFEPEMKSNWRKLSLAISFVYLFIFFHFFLGKFI